MNNGNAPVSIARPLFYVFLTLTFLWILPASADGLNVNPTNTFVVVGNAGGPFSPSNQVYSLTNSGTNSLDWSATYNQSWLSFSATNGTLAAGESTNLLLFLNSNANVLAAGSYPANILFSNLTDAVGTDTRLVNVFVNDLTNGLVAYYPFNGNANDISGKGNNGTAVNTGFQTNPITGIVSAQFSGTSSTYVVVPSSSSLSPVTGLTIAMWCYGAPGACGSTLIRKANSCNAGYIIRGCPTPTFLFCSPGACSSGGTSQVDFPALPTANWQLIVGTYSPASQMLYSYVNGVLTGQSVATNSQANSGSLFIGGSTVSAGDNGFNGLMNEVRIYNRALTGPEIQQLYLGSSNSMPFLAVSPATDFVINGESGGPFSPSSRAYTLTNGGSASLNWAVTNSQNWLDLSATAGTLEVGSGTTVTVSINSNANTLGTGNYADNVIFTNLTNGSGSSIRPVYLAVSVPVLEVTPSDGLVSIGAVGGSFTPSSQAYTLTNSGGAVLNWAATQNQGWLSLSPTNGVLGIGTGTIVTVSINSNANSLVVSNYSATISFTNLSNNIGTTTRGVALTVTLTPPPVPPSLTATNVAYNQINLSWSDSSTNEAGFKIERSADGVNFIQVAQVLSNTVKYFNTGLFPNRRYYYRVRSYRTNVDSAPSPMAWADTPALCTTKVIGWGDNSAGATNIPGGLTNVVALAAGVGHGMALKSDGNLVEWGSNNSGVSTPPTGLTGVVAIAGGWYDSLALKGDGTVVGWGQGSWGELTIPSNLTNVVAIATGHGVHSLALKSDGTVVAWGGSCCGTPAPPAGLAGVVAIAAGEAHGLALKSDGTVVAWGLNASGQATVPAGLSNVVSIAAGWSFSMALKSDGTVVAWGDNSSGQRVPPAGLANVVAITAGGYFGMALKDDGSVVAWGDNSKGQATVPTALGSTIATADGYSTSLALTLTCVPTTPTNLTATALTATQTRLGWVDTSTNELGFLIERAPEAGGGSNGWAQINSIALNLTNYIDSGLSVYSKYWYRVRAYNARGMSPYSNLATATTPPPTNSWISPLSDSWQFGTNWLLQIPPDIAQSATFITNANTKTVTINALTSSSYSNTLTISNLTVSAPVGASNTLSLQNAGTVTPLRVLKSLTVGTRGSVVLTNSTLVADGVSPGTVIIDGTMSLAGGGAVIVTNTPLHLGGGGAGALAINGGSAVVQRLRISAGVNSTGTLTLNAGSFLALAGVDIAPVTTASNAFVWVNGGQLLVTNTGSQLTVGGFNAGQLTLSNGTITALALVVGNSAGSLGTLILAGGTLVTSTGIIGNSTAYRSEAWLTGSQWSMPNGPLTVGVSGWGRLVISNGSLTAQSLQVGSLGTLTHNGGLVTVQQLALTNSGLYDLNGGTLTVGNSTTVSNGYSFNVGTGTKPATLRLIGGVHTYNNSLHVFGQGTVIGCGTINGGVLIDAGAVMLADCGGTLTFQGVVTNNGTLWAVNGTTLAFGSNFVNNGTLNYILGSVNFNSGSMNNGIVLDRDGDPDGDGWSNLQELTAGTDPLNSASFMHLTGLLADGTNVLVTWQAGAGRTNVVQVTSELASSSSYSNISPNILILGNGQVTTNYLDLGGVTNGAPRFYRIKVVP